MTATSKIVVIRCGTCTYRLAYPTFFLEANKSNVRKIFKLLYRHNWQNRETIEFLEREMPNLAEEVAAQGAAKVEEKAERLRRVRADYDRDFLDPDPSTFPKGMIREQIRAEKAARKEWNAPRWQRVKDAKANHDRAKNDASKNTQRARQIYDLFVTEKRSI